MKRSFHMTIQQATKDYERWLTGQLEIVPEDLAAKHEKMRQAPFPFLRATYYRWALLFPQLCKELSRAPQVLAVGDLHVENFGTWRDVEGRLVWGINDFDEAAKLAPANDLVRLTASAHAAAPINPSTIRNAKKKRTASGISAPNRSNIRPTPRLVAAARLIPKG